MQTARRQTRLTLLRGLQVVTKDSSTIDGKPSIPVDADHRTLQRCENAFTGNYLQIVQQIDLTMAALDRKSQSHGPQ